MSERFSPEQLEAAAQKLEWHLVEALRQHHDGTSAALSNAQDGLRQAAADARTLAALREWLKARVMEYENADYVAEMLYGRTRMAHETIAHMDRLMARPDGAEETQG